MPPLGQAVEFVRLGFRFGGALVRHAIDGLADVSPEAYAGRLGACDGCDRRTENWSCSHPACGCRIHVKAKWRSESCPLGKWDRAEEGQAKNTFSKCGCSKEVGAGVEPALPAPASPPQNPE